MAHRDERREHIRHPCYAKASIAGKFMAYVRDLSECGARLSVIRPTPFGPGEVLWLRAPVSGEGEPELLTSCSVVWGRRMGPYCEIGVSFREADAAMREMVRQFAQVLAERHSQAGRWPEVQVEVIEQAEEDPAPQV